MAAAGQRMVVSRIDARQNHLLISANSLVVEEVCDPVGGVYDGAELMVIPAVRVVVGHDDRSRVPKLRLLDEVDRVDQELLLVQWIGFSGVASPAAFSIFVSSYTSFKWRHFAKN